MNEHTEYWLTESLESLDTARVLYDNKKYLDSSFFCHLSMEKMLKAFYTDRTNDVPPKIHNLLLLAERAHLKEELGDQQLVFLARLNTYNIEGRYPSQREALYKNTSVNKFLEILVKTEEVIKWLELKLRSEAL